MKHFDFFRLFSNNSHSPNGKNKRKRNRILRIEELEGREMLSADLFNAVHAAYGDLDLGDDWTRYNYIEIQADNLTDVAIRNAIATAGTTTKDDIIVVRTTATENKITLIKDWNINELAININAAQFGSIAIVSLGDKPLTFDTYVGQSRVFNIESASNVTLAGLIITGGNAWDQGGGINNAGSLIVTNCTISGNTAYGDGGGIYNNAGSLTVINSTISGNTADDGGNFKGGGGIYNNAGSLTVINSTISGNTAHFGGGIYSLGSTMTVTNCTISGNTAHFGGGIHSLGSTMTLTNSTIEGNIANGDAEMGAGKGGGISQYQGTTTITHCVIAENTASDGGGIQCLDSTLVLTNCTVEGNTARRDGGGICLDGTLTLMNSTVVGNIAAHDGGGIYQSGVSVMVNCVVAGNRANYGGGIFQTGSRSSIINCSITNCTIAGNAADLNGGGIYHAYSDLVVNNSIVVQNQALSEAGQGKDIYKVPPLVAAMPTGSISGRYNLIGITDGTLTLSNAVVGDPKFVAIPATIDASTTGENYNPADWDLRLQSGSVAINTGHNSLAVDAHDQLLTSDLDGNPRIIGGTVDLGAYEYSSIATAPILDVVEALNGSTLEAYFSGVPTAGGYLVQYATDVAFSINVDTVKATTNVKRIYDLEPNTVYYVRVAACDSDGNIASVWSNIIEARTLQGELPDRPSNVKAINVSTTSATLFWTGVPEAVGYEVQYSWDGGKTWGSKTTSGDMTVIVDELVAGVYCMFRVRAEMDEGMSDWSDIIVAQTLPTVKPANVEATDVTAVSIKLSWTGVFGASSYEIQYSLDEGETWNFGATSDYTIVDVNNLAANANYLFRICAVMGEEEKSDWSDTIVVQTLPDKPTNVEITDTAATSVTLSWTGVPDAVGYEIQYSLDGGKSWIFGTTSDDAAVNVDKLAADMHYLLRVRAVMSEGDTSDWSDVSVAKTSAAESIVAAAKPKKVVVAKGAEKPTINALTLNISKNTKLAEAANTASYIVFCTSNPMLKFSYTVTGDKVFVEGLLPGTKYTFAVQAIHQNGNVSAVVSVKATTAKYTAVKSLKKGAITANSVTLSWKPSTAPAQTTGYVIEVYDATGKTLLYMVPITDVSTMTYTIPGLDAKAKYTFVVKATDGVYESIAAKIKVATTAV